MMKKHLYRGGMCQEGPPPSALPQFLKALDHPMVGGEEG